MNWILDEEAVAAWDERGYHIIDDAYTQDELDAFDATLLHTVRILVKQASGGENPFRDDGDPHGEIDRATHWLEEQDHYYIAQLYHMLADMPAFLHLGIKPGLSKVAAQLLGCSSETPLYTLTKRCRIDLSMETDYTFGWHQEVFYSVPKSCFLQTWAPLLRPSTVANGAIEVAVGSHKGGVADQVWTMNDGIPNQIIVKDEVIERYETKTVLLEPGQLIMFSNKMAHRSGQNTSGTTRFSLVSSFHRMDSEDFQAPRFSGVYIGIDPHDYYRSLLHVPAMGV